MAPLKSPGRVGAPGEGQRVPAAWPPARACVVGGRPERGLPTRRITPGAQLPVSRGTGGGTNNRGAFAGAGSRAAVCQGWLDREACGGTRGCPDVAHAPLTLIPVVVAENDGSMVGFGGGHDSVLFHSSVSDMPNGGSALCFWEPPAEPLPSAASPSPGPPTVGSVSPRLAVPVSAGGLPASAESIERLTIAIRRPTEASNDVASAACMSPRTKRGRIR